MYKLRFGGEEMKISSKYSEMLVVSFTNVIVTLFVKCFKVYMTYFDALRDIARSFILVSICFRIWKEKWRLISFSLWHDLGFINNENGEDESEAMQLAATQSNADNNVSITLKILNVSTTTSLFDEGKMLR